MIELPVPIVCHPVMTGRRTCHEGSTWLIFYHFCVLENIALMAYVDWVPISLACAALLNGYTRFTTVRLPLLKIKSEAAVAGNIWGALTKDTHWQRWVKAMNWRVLLNYPNMFIFLHFTSHTLIMSKTLARSSLCLQDYIWLCPSQLVSLTHKAPHLSNAPSFVLSLCKTGCRDSSPQLAVMLSCQNPQTCLNHNQSQGSQVQ